MQIQPPISAAGAAGIAAQSSAKESNTPSASSSGISQEATVEKSEQSNQDRDAQGQGDGLADRGGEATNSHDDSKTPETETAHQPAPRLPGEPPARLDIMG